MSHLFLVKARTISKKFKSGGTPAALERISVRYKKYKCILRTFTVRLSRKKVIYFFTKKNPTTLSSDRIYVGGNCQTLITKPEVSFLPLPFAFEVVYVAYFY